MPTFKPVVRTDKEYNSVYIRISHNSQTDYIKTEMILHRSGIKKGEISDYTVLGNCAIKIKSYIEKINTFNPKNLTVGELKEILTSERKEISFTDFAEKYIDKMRTDGRTKPAGNYRTALNSLLNHFKKENILFSEITSKSLRKWIESLSGTARAKQAYPVAIKKIFEEGCLEYNDYDRNIIQIPGRPFKAVSIPESELPKKRYIEPSELLRITETEPLSEREKLAHDVILIVLNLAGINTVDLYNAEKNAFSDGKLCYNRKKTEGKRKDKAYFEITVRSEILPLFEKYKGQKKLFGFAERYATADNFCKAVNKGILGLCLRSGVRRISVYWLRHTWATIAQNRCGASIELVGFCLNHSSAHRVTEGYIEKDFSAVDILNEKVLSCIFGERA